MFEVHRFNFSRDEDQEGADRQTTSLAGLAFALLLVVVGLFLVRALHSKAMMEDCLMSGRTNCAPVIVAGGDGSGPRLH
jgi:hypothetical protein